MPHLRSIEPRGAIAGDRFPFNVPVIRNLRALEASATVTFLVGENGSGKSTLLEGIAAAAGLPTIGSESLDSDPTLNAQRELGSAIKLVWNRRVRRGFFLRAEDFFGFAKALSRLRAEMLGRLEEIETEFANRSAHARTLARLPAMRSLMEMEQRYGVNLDANSHGQSFLKLFRSRFVPDGLYLLDEPEAPLSPQSQLALISMIGDMIQDNAQFIIATHSPILLGYPGASIYSFDGGSIARVEYEELDHVVVTRDFLNGRERFLRYL
ncbi:MAG TPA: AAA family ATPase [Gemmatimonadaceae bacterium]|nr:AAA family ATPase [Gemmatimonadaceae bacterium]